MMHSQQQLGLLLCSCLSLVQGRGGGGRTTTLYTIGDGQCGENDVDSRAVRFAKLFQPGLIEGTCAENGYTIPAGTNDVDTPLGKITTRLFTEAGPPTISCDAENAAQMMQDFGDACQDFPSASDPAICGSNCETSATVMAGCPTAISSMPELQPMIDGIQATCSQPKDCIVAEIGQGDDTGAVTVPLQRGYTCPATVSKDVWEGTATYDDTYAITQADGMVTATRTDAPGRSWGMDLQFECCMGQDAGVEIREEVCVTVDVGSSRSISKVASVDPAYSCPDRVSKDEWLGGAEYDDTYGVEQKGGDLTVTRTDDADAHGWGMDLQIECCAENEMAAEQCVVAEIGSSTEHSKRATIDAGYTCPSMITKDEWEGDATYGDEYTITQAGGQITATRADVPEGGWGMDLNFKCCAGQDASVEIKEQTCMMVTVGSSREPTKDAAKPVPAGFFCPASVSKEEWAGGATYDDTYDISQTDAGVVTAERTDTVGGWGMNLQFECCNTDGTAAPGGGGRGGGGRGGGAGLKSIVETAVSMPDTFSTLVSAVTAAGLAGTLGGPGPFTVFAPTNDAFAAAQAAGVDLAALLRNQAALTKVLTYHVHAGAVHAGDLRDGMDVSTLEGQTISVAIARRTGIVTLNGVASVVTADVECSNGVVHVIDAVLLPPAEAQGNAECWEGAYTFDRCCDTARGRKPTGDPDCWSPGWDFSTCCGAAGGGGH